MTRGDFCTTAFAHNHGTAEHAAITSGADIVIFDDGEEDFILKPRYGMGTGIFRYELVTPDKRHTFYAFDNDHALRIMDTFVMHDGIEDYTLLDEELETLTIAA
jgi:hypothetical protein